MNIHELRDELHNKKNNQSFLFGGKIDLDRKLFETNLAFEDIEEVQSC